MIIAVPFVLPTLLPLIVAFFWLRHRYITTGREVKRFDATTRSPVYASFSAALKVLHSSPNALSSPQAFCTHPSCSLCMTVLANG